MKVDIEKLRAILLESGLPEEEVEKVLAKLGEEEPVDEGKGEEPITSEEKPVEEGGEPSEPVVEEEVAVEGPQEEIPAETDSVPEPAPEEEVPVEVPAEGGELPPVEEEALPAELPPELPPVVSVEEFNAVKDELEETKKAVEGLKAANQSLLEALQKAGVISGGSLPVLGQDSPSVPGSASSDDTMDNILAEINRKGY